MIFDFDIDFGTVEEHIGTFIEEAEESKDINGSSESLEELLKEVIDDKDLQTLSIVLKQARHLLSNQSMANLLLKGCDRFFIKGIELLLLHGADPNLPAMHHQFEDNKVDILNFVINKHCHNVPGPIPDSRLRHNSERIRETIGLLLEYGANPMNHDNILPYKWQNIATMFGNNLTSIHKLAYLSLYGEENCLKIISRMDFDQQNGNCSPLSAIFFDFINMPRDQGIEHMSLVVKNAILPMLRSGAHLHPDPLEGEGGSIDSLLPLFCLEFQSDDFWVLKNANFVDLLLEMRRKQTLNVNKFHNSLMAGISDDNSEVGFVAKYRRFYKTILNNFPMPLQSLCRRSILNNLPLTYQARRKSISQLNMLPDCVKDYLNFSEFEPIIVP